jgi:predicted nucleic acid-binding protein
VIVVSDASPLIYLGGLGQLDLLDGLFDVVVVPRVVIDEVIGAGAGRTGARELADATWIRIEDAEPPRVESLSNAASESSARWAYCSRPNDWGSSPPSRHWWRAWTG